MAHNDIDLHMWIEQNFRIWVKQNWRKKIKEEEGGERDKEGREIRVWYWRKKIKGGGDTGSHYNWTTFHTPLWEQKMDDFIINYILLMIHKYITLFFYVVLSDFIINYILLMIHKYITLFFYVVF